MECLARQKERRLLKQRKNECDHGRETNENATADEVLSAADRSYKEAEEGFVHFTK